MIFKKQSPTEYVLQPQKKIAQHSNKSIRFYLFRGFYNERYIVHAIIIIYSIATQIDAAAPCLTATEQRKARNTAHTKMRIAFFVACLL